MNLTELRTRLRRQIGNPTTAAIPDATLDIYLNGAYRDIAEKYKFHKARRLCRFDTVSGSDKYDLPTDTGTILKVRNVTDEERLRMYDRNEIFENVEEDGKPLYWAHIRDWIQLFPTPDGVYTIEMWYKAGVFDLSDANPTPIMPASWHEAIPLLARHKYYDDAGDMGKAINALNIYKNWVQDKPVEVNEEKQEIDRGVIIPTLARGVRSRVDFDEE